MDKLVNVLLETLRDLEESCYLSKALFIADSITGMDPEYPCVRGLFPDFIRILDGDLGFTGCPLILVPSPSSLLYLPNAS